MSVISELDHVYHWVLVQLQSKIMVQFYTLTHLMNSHYSLSFYFLFLVFAENSFLHMLRLIFGGF